MTQATIEVWSIISTTTVTVTTLALLIVRPMLLRQGMIDTPNHRSSHSVPTPRGGGMGILIGLVAGMLVLLLTVDGAAVGNELAPLIVTFVVICLFGLVGWGEDLINLPVRSRLISQIVIATLTGVGFALTTPILGTAVAIAVPTIVFYVNAANFMDGINGISAQHGVIVAVYFGILAYGDEKTLLALSACVIACAFISFLPWNTGRALMFLGDTGSYALGAMAALLAIWTMTKHLEFIVIAAPLLIYAADVLFTLVKRACRRASLITSHREHVYQRLQQATGSHALAAFVVAILTVSCCALGLFTAAQPELRAWSYIGAASLIAIYLTSPRWILIVPTAGKLPAAVGHSAHGLPNVY